MKKTPTIILFFFIFISQAIAAGEAKTIICDGKSVKEVIARAEIELNKHKNFLLLSKKMYKISLSTHIIEIQIQKNE